VLFVKGCGPTHYKPQENLEKKATALDPNHTHFILVDDGTENMLGVEIELRSKFEAHVSTLKTIGGKNSPFCMWLMLNLVKFPDYGVLYQCCN